MRGLVALAACCGLLAGGSQAAAPAVRIVVDDADRLVVVNDDGRWTIWKRFQPGSRRSAGVISEFRPRGQRYAYVNDASDSPLRLAGGLGGFSFHWARRDGFADQPDRSPYLEFANPAANGDADIDRNHAWGMFADQWSPGGFGIGAVRVHRPAEPSDDGFRFGTTVDFRDGSRSPVLRVRYEYEFAKHGVRLWVYVTTLCDDGDCGASSSGRLGFVKEPRLIATLAPRPNGRLIYPHATILDARGRALDAAQISALPEDTEGNQKQIRSSVLERGATTIRFDDAAGGCTVRVHRCFYVTARSYPGGSEPHEATPSLWASERFGLWAWALASNERPCFARYGVNRAVGLPPSCNPPPSLGSFGDPRLGGPLNLQGRRGLVKTWKIVRRKPLGFASAKFFGWEGCLGAYDCPIASRLLGRSGETWAAYLGFSYGA